MEFNYELKIPKDRVAVLIGTKGTTKRRIEKSTKSSLKIDSEEGDVFISGEDALGLFTAREIVRAIGRGFNPDIALLLLKQDYVFEILDLKDFAGKNKSTLIRLKGRVIGDQGRSRKTIEQLTECYISVTGKTIGIIGEAENATIARQAIENLLEGSTHANVYRFLEKKRRERKRMLFEMRPASL
ncbi:MAG: KH domain-containing protein [Candidatus Woesearchaeota archaeon]